MVAAGALTAIAVSGLPGGASVPATAQPAAVGSTPVPRFSVSDVRVDEAAGTASFVVSVSAPAAASVQYSTVDGSAAAPGDYAATNGLVQFSALGPTSLPVTVPVVPDAVREAFEVFTLHLQAPSTGALIADDTGTATIVDDDGLPAQLSIRGVPSAPEGGAAVFTVAVEGTLDQSAVIQYTTVKGGASAPGDFRSTTGTLSLPPGPSPSATVTVPVVDDTRSEGNESFSLKVMSATNVTVADASANVVIPANDGGTGPPVPTGPRMSVDDVRVGEAAGSASFTVTLTKPGDVTVAYSTPAGSATASAPGDYTPVSGKLTFHSTGPSSARVSVPVVADTRKELFEVVTLVLSTPTGGAVIADAAGIATVVDDDGLPPQLTVADVEQPTPEGGTAEFLVALSGTPDEAVTISVALTPGSAGTADYGSPSPSSIFFPAGVADQRQLISVAVTQDALAEPDEVFRLQGTATPTADLADPVGQATIAGTSGADPVIAAAGDIACDPASSLFRSGNGTTSACRQLATSNLLLGSGLAGVLTLGDNQYQGGQLSKFQASYDPSWGRALALTHPAVGNHEYYSPGAAGYYDYFKTAAGDRTNGYYSLDIGAWHLIALNAECSYVGGCGPGSRQEQWLRADLAAHPAACTLAYWHQPRFSSGEHGSDPAYDAFWQALWEAGADVVLNGHDHDYERFAPQSPAGAPDPLTGIRQFVVGTGGATHYSFLTAQPNSEVRNSDTFGVLRLTLHASAFDWEFVPAAGGSFSDSGSSVCH